VAEAVVIPASVDPAGRSGGRIALLLLTLIGTINFMDRQLLSVLVEPIRAELHLSDTMFGLLTGLCFALVYAVLGVPAAMLADRSNRVRLVAGACMVWSVFTAACGMAGNFWQLALARFGVGVGEAGGTAPSLSILSDYYPPQSRAAVTGLFTVNGPLGVFLGISLGGWAAQEFGWRGAFFAIGLLGVLVAPLLLLLVREPVRGATEGVRAPVAPAPSLVATIRLLWRQPTLRMLFVASGSAAFVSYGMLNWLPAFLMRERGMPLAELAKWFGPAAGLCMGLGIWGGGALVSAAARRNVAAYGWLPATSMALTAPLLASALFAPGWGLSLLLMVAPMITCICYVAPALALAQNLAPINVRATATALLLLAFNIIGLGLGPLAVGLASDALNRAGVAHALQWAILLLAPVALGSALAYLAMSRTVAADAAGMPGTPEYA
jgi:predicted MFS family arabinose efflux permease